MRLKVTTVAIGFAIAAPLFAQNKESDRLVSSATVLQQLLSGGLPTTVLDKAMCVLIFPGVKKVAIGIGGSYGRGEMVCRKGAEMNGAWGAPVMYTLDAGSVGIQLGATSTDFLLAVMNHNGASQILNGKTKLGSNASAAAGPGAQATGFSSEQMSADVLTYSRTKGVFAGVSLAGASLEVDNDANKAVYGRAMTASQIEAGPVPAAGEGLVGLLNRTSAVRKGGQGG
jgi:SH3 domain-containing YSC84-like protein 1